MSLPNYLTILRLCVVPFIAIALLGHFTYHDELAAALYAAAAVTDSLDGYIARSRRLVTDLGKFLDPLADKLLVVSVLAILVAQSSLPLWVALVVVVREAGITALRSVGASRGVVVASTPWGKAKTLSQNIMIGLVILERAFGWLATPATIMVAAAVVATVGSGADLIWRYRTLFSARRRDEDPR